MSARQTPPEGAGAPPPVAGDGQGGAAAKKINCRTRRLLIINQLADLSRGGWANARAYDWQTLEADLRALEARQ